MMKRIFIIISALFLFSTINAQSNLKETEAKFIFGFAKLINWNKTYNENVVINVLGETVVLDYLSLMAENNNVAGRKVIVREANQSNLYKCNILFVTTEKENDLMDILSSPHNDILIVFEGDDLLYLPADVTFKVKYSEISSFLSYIVNYNSITNKNFKFAPEFIGYAKIK